MFTKNVSLTDKIESHINSSSDENGEDDSFDSDGKEEFFNPNIEEIKSKIEKYKHKMYRMKLKQKEIENDKNVSLWRCVYNTFFGNYVKGAVSLHELNVRSKFIFNMDKCYNFEKEIEKRKIKPLTNMESFIKNYSMKKDTNILVKIFTENKKKVFTEDVLDIQKRIRNFNLKKKNHHKPSSSSDYFKENKIMLKSKSVDSLGEENNIIQEKRYYLKNLLELNDFHLQDEELFDIIQELNAKYKESGDLQKLENLSKIIRGDFIYKQELDNIYKKNWNNDPFLRECNTILDVNSERQFLINNIDVDLISKYEHHLQPQDRLSRQVNNFVDKVLIKLNPNFKVEI